MKTKQNPLQAPGYVHALDGIRAVAVFMVMVFHFFQVFNLQNAAGGILERISLFGQTGVTFFFVLSGFLITRILLATKGAEKYFWNFYIRRTLRIFPLYYFYLLLFYFLFPMIVGLSVIPFGLQVYNWIYLQDFAQTFNWNFKGPDHFWSLAVEEHFYLFWPFLIYFLNKRGIVIAIVTTLLTSFLVRIWLTHTGTEVYYFTFSRMDDLAMGAILAILELDGKLGKASASKFQNLFFVFSIPTLMLWVYFSGKQNAIMQVLKFNLISTVYFSIIGFVITVKDSHWLKRLLTIPAMLFTGRISYGLYVYHPACYWIFGLYLKTNSIVLNFLGCICLTFLTASLSYNLFEKRFLKLKNYFT